MKNTNNSTDFLNSRIEGLNYAELEVLREDLERELTIATYMGDTKGIAHCESELKDVQELKGDLVAAKHFA